MNKALILYISISLFSFSMETEDNDIGAEIVSVALDFVPLIGNVKGLEEAISGVDLVTGKNLTDAERILCIISAIPFGNYLRNGKHLKNGQKFLKAAERAQKAGKLKNALKFTKAASRAMKKAKAIGEFIKKVPKMLKLTKFTKYTKLFGENQGNNTSLFNYYNYTNNRLN